MLKFAIAAALAAVAARASADARIVTPQTAATHVIRTDDLRLESRAGVAELDRRIARAARALCGDPSTWDLEGANQATRCRATTVAAAARQRDRIVAQAHEKALALTR